jgi:hypothetical protein
MLRMLCGRKEFLVRFPVLMPVSIFWVLTPCRLTLNAEFSEKHTVSIFRVEVMHPNIATLSLKMESCFSETSISPYQYTRCQNPQEQRHQKTSFPSGNATQAAQSCVTSLHQYLRFISQQ